MKSAFVSEKDEENNVLDSLTQLLSRKLMLLKSPHTKSYYDSKYLFHVSYRPILKILSFGFGRNFNALS